MAHVIDSAFQTAHLALAEAFPQDVVVSLHGMQREGVSVSDGTTAAVAAQARVARFAEALSTELPAGLVTTCNDYGAGNHEVHLCGSTNTQGRAVNGSPQACGAAASAASERFLHLEQHIDVRQSPLTVAAALEAVLP